MKKYKAYSEKKPPTLKEFSDALKDPETRSKVIRHCPLPSEAPSSLRAQLAPMLLLKQAERAPVKDLHEIVDMQLQHREMVLNLPRRKMPDLLNQRFLCQQGGARLQNMWATSSTALEGT